MNSSTCMTQACGSAARGSQGRWHRFGRFINLRLAAGALAVGVLVPLGVVFSAWGQPQPEIWQHLFETLLAELLRNTFVLCAGVLTGTFLLGTAAAWVTTMCAFPGRRLFAWALILPITMPTYVLAFVFIGLFDFSGPLQTFTRNHFPTLSGAFPDIRSTGGVITVMTLALYPYVYLLAASAFRTQGARSLEAARVSGCSRRRAFWKVALPMARPWIAAGLLLVLMETLADFGAVSIFNFDTLTTAIYKAWFGLFSLPAAAQLSSLLLAAALVVVWVEQRLRADRRFSPVGKSHAAAGVIELRGWHRWAVPTGLTLLLATAFVLPCVQLIVWALEAAPVELNRRYLGLLLRTLFFAGSATVAITACGLLLAYVQRRYPDPATGILVRLATIGYALPGTVLAVGVVVALALVDRLLALLARQVLGIELDAVLQGAVLTVILAYTVRFLTAGFNSVSSALQRVTRSLDEAAALQGVTGGRLLARVHVPMLKSGLLTAGLLVFVDVMKEMPITLMTRPFGWDTLAVKIFELTSEGEWQRAALPSITLVLVGLLPLVLLNRRLENLTA